MAKKTTRNRGSKGALPKKGASPARRAAGKTARKARRKTASAAPARSARKKAAGRKKAAPARKAVARKKTVARKKATAPARKKAVARKAPAKKAKAPARKPRPAAKRTAPARTAARPAAKRSAPSRPAARRGGTGREETLAQTPETGRTRQGPTNPRPTRRSTGTPAGAGSTRAPRLDRARRELREIEEGVPTPPSSLDLDRDASAVRSGRLHLQQAREDHTEVSPEITGGDVDADWQDAYAVGDEAPGGDNPTPDQDRVDDIGKALGVEYQDNEELKASDKIAERDKHRWELDPASSEDYPDRD
jgi:hypothetical protein